MVKKKSFKKAKPAKETKETEIKISLVEEGNSVNVVCTSGGQKWYVFSFHVKDGKVEVYPYTGIVDRNFALDEHGSIKISKEY